MGACTVRSGTDVRLPFEPVQRRRHPGTRRLAVVAGPASDRLGSRRVVGRGTPRTTPRSRAAPALLDLAIVCVPLLGGPGPRYSSSHRPHASVPNRTSAAVGPDRSPRRRSPAARSSPCRSDRSLGAGGLHHLKASATRVSSVGSRSTVSGSERPAPRGRRGRGARTTEGREERAERGYRPEELDVRVRRRDHQDVDRSVAGDLVRDVRPVGGPRVVDVGHLRPILCRFGRAGQTDGGRR